MMKRLNDAQMRFFIQNGYISVRPSLPPEFHAEVFRQTEIVFEKEGNPGNNLLPRIPMVQQVFDDPVVHGALTSIFGRNYYLHPHRHCHYNPPGSKGQTMHKDSWTRRRHHTRWGMAFYYPQDTPETLGPTGIVPESQYYNSLPTGNGSKGELPLSGEAGTVVIVHYDLWHRAMPNLSDKRRYMMKFLFTRMEEPNEPSWESDSPDWSPTGDEQDAMWGHLWDWHSGYSSQNGNGASRPVQELTKALKVSENYSAVYTLAQLGETAIPLLIEMLQDDVARRNAGYALSAIGAPAVPALIDAMTDQSPEVVAMAAETLGDIGPAAEAAAPVVAGVLGSQAVSVRRNAAEALGLVTQNGTNGVAALAQALKDPDEWVRRHASLGLARIGVHAETAIPALTKALHDDNRYVRANSAHTLFRIGTPEAREALFPFLFNARWCSLTSRESQY